MFVGGQAESIFAATIPYFELWIWLEQQRVKDPALKSSIVGISDVKNNPAEFVQLTVFVL